MLISISGLRIRAISLLFALCCSPAAFAVADDSATTEFLQQVVIDVLANDTLNPGDTISEVSTPTRGGFVELLDEMQCIAAADIMRQCVRYSPPSSDENGAPFTGDDTFTYTVVNADALDRVATVTVTVLAQAPSLADDTATTMTATPITIDVRANDFPQAGESIVAVSMPPSGSALTILDATTCAGLITTQNAECLRYEPRPASVETPAFAGSEMFSYTVSNGETTSTAVVTVSVTPGEVPVMRALMADAVTTNVETLVIIDVLGNDTLEGGDQLIAVSVPANGGSAELLADAQCGGGDGEFFGACVRYTPPPTSPEGVVFVGDDTFTYTVGTTGDSDTATVTVSVVAPGGTPEPIADDRSDVVAGEAVVIDVLANDLDDGGIERLTIISVTEPANGTATINSVIEGNDTITYLPDAGFVGNDRFFYTVSDGDQATVDRAAEVTITVSAAAGQNTLASLALTPQERELASAIDSVCANLRGADTVPDLPPPAESPQADTAEVLTSGQANLLERCTALIALANPPDGSDTTAAVRDALRQISGEEVFAQETLSMRILSTQVRNIDSRLAALRGGARGVSVQGVALNVGGKTLPNGLFARGGGASADGQSEDGQGNALLADSRLGLFMNGRLNFGERGPTGDENGFDFDTLGVTAGIDYRFRNDLVLGAALGFADAQADYNNTGGELDSDSLTYSLYGTYFTDRFYIDVFAGVGDIDFDSQRTLLFADGGSGVDTQALGTTEGDQRLVSANFGYNIDHNGWLFVPFIGYDYIDTAIDGYSETEGQGWELAFDDQKIRSQIVSAGLRVSFTKSTSFGVIVPHLRVAAQEEFEDDARVITARFVNDPTNTRFRFTNPGADSSFLQLATGISMQMENGIAGFVDYETTTGYDNLDTSTLTFGVRFERRFE
ncbi:MAG: autotransporter domain-containing protein [Pseudomonadota bacterium]